MVSSASLPLAFLGLTWPMLFWGAALGGIPIVIHLLYRRKFRETSWAAMRFLLEAARKHSRRLRLEQLILLAVRTLLLLFLVGGLQGLYAVTTASARVGEGPIHHVLVIDASMSMQWKPDGRNSLFDRAREIALDIVDSSADGDAFNLVLITGNRERSIVKAPVRSMRGFRDVVQRNAETVNGGGDRTPGIDAGDEPSRLLESLKEVEQILGKANSIPAKRVYVISDFQKLTWRPESRPLRDRIHKSFQTIGTASLVMIDVGRDQAPNTAVTALKTEQPFVIAGRALRVHSTVHHFGRQRVTRQAELLVDGQVRDMQTVVLEPGVEREVSWTYPNPKARGAQPELTAGEHRIAVRLKGDNLATDNTRRLAIPVKQRLRVLLVNGRSSARPRDEATFFVEKSLQQTTTDRPTTAIVEPRVISESRLARTDLSRFDGVFLCDVRTLKQSEARKLRAFVESGGGLVIAMGDRVSLSDYNAVLYRNGNGLLAAKLDSLATIGNDNRRLYLFDTAKLNHPIVDQFVGNPDAGLAGVMAFRYVKVQMPDDAPHRVVLRFLPRKPGTPGDPVIIESARGRGRVLLVTTSLDARWTTWPVTGSFLPTVHEMLYYAISGQWQERQHAVGYPIIRTFPAFSRAVPPSVAVKTPDNVVRTVPLTGSDRWFVRRGGADFYEQLPKDDMKPAGRIPAETPVRRFELRKDFSRIGWRGRVVWVRNSSLERRGNSLFFFDETHRSGFYEVRFKPPIGSTTFYAVNTDPAESNLEKIGKAQLGKDVLPGVDHRYRTHWDPAEESRQVASTHQNPLTRWLLIAVFCLLLVELLMAWRFPIGFAVLYVLIAFEVARHTAGWNLAGGIVLGLLLVGVPAGILWRRRRGLDSHRSTA